MERNFEIVNWQIKISNEFVKEAIFLHSFDYFGPIFGQFLASSACGPKKFSTARGPARLVSISNTNYIGRKSLQIFSKAEKELELRLGESA